VVQGTVTTTGPPMLPPMLPPPLPPMPWAGDATNADPSKAKTAISDNFLAWMNIGTLSKGGSERN
jgi:hypothetical protein